MLEAGLVMFDSVKAGKQHGCTLVWKPILVSILEIYIKYSIKLKQAD